MPDVAGDADPATGYAVIVDGVATVIGGTSAVAPLWAGLLARVNEALGTPVGFVTPRLYSLALRPAFRDITSGNNGGYSAGSGVGPLHRTRQPRWGPVALGAPAPRGWRLERAV